MLTLEEINSAPPELLRDMRDLWKGRADPNDLTLEPLREILRTKPRDFLEQLAGLEKSHKAHLAAIERGKARGVTSPPETGQKSPVAGTCPACGQEILGPEPKNEAIGVLIARLIEECKG